jgi:hypothetical protein
MTEKLYNIVKITMAPMDVPPEEWSRIKAWLTNAINVGGGTVKFFEADQVLIEATFRTEMQAAEFTSAFQRVVGAEN